ncbi:hypothetical protein BGZ83_000016 [Gryganskiella cystojenkinii]|nr:hypothetical protein BGZ83_000016 [Gryganskiella cystojenkinii]
MSNFFTKRRKHELKDIAANLGLSIEGVREDLVDRIRHHITKHGSKDPSLRELVRELTGRRSTESSRLVSLSSANEDEDTSDTSTPRVTRSSPKKDSPKKVVSPKKTRTVVETHKTSRTESDSESAEDPLSEHRVRDFMEHVHVELGEAKKMAHSLEHTLQDKYQTGKKAIRRASADFTSTVSHALDDVVGAVTGGSNNSDTAQTTSHRRRGSRHEDHRGGYRSRHHEHEGGEHEGGVLGWCGSIRQELKHRFAECAGTCGFSTCASEYWRRLHDLGSTSAGFVWITFTLELLVFLTAAFTQHEHKDGDDWFSCLSFFTNWAGFLKPFFSYYSTLFVIPTLLSQLFNVDRVSATSSSSHGKHSGLTGLLSRKTTSGLSYFVFKFAMTYFLSQTSIGSYHHGSSGLLGLAKDAAETFANHTGFGPHHPALLEGCKFLGEVFRYVPSSLSLATSGAGTILALAESVVRRR